MYLGEIKVVLCDTLCCAVLGNKKCINGVFYDVSSLLWFASR